MNRLDVFCFVSVARTLSFSTTARELMISQQAVSRHIRNLEEEIGYPLFLRNYQTVELTKAGEKLLTYFSQRDSLLEELEGKMKRFHKDEILKIGWSQWTSCPSWFQELLALFQKRYPQVKMLCFDLDASEMKSAQMKEELDFILTTRYGAKYLPAVWKQRVLGEEPIVVLKNPESYGDLERKIYAADAGEHDQERIKMRTRSICQELQIPYAPVQVMPEMGSVCMNVLTNGGMAFGLSLPVLAANEDFVVEQTNRTATIVLCSPFQTSKESAVLFETFIQQMEEEDK